DEQYTLTAAHYLAWALRERGRYADARDLDQDTLARRRRVLGENHPHTLISAGSLAIALRDVGEMQAARDLDQDTLERRRRVLGQQPRRRRSHARGDRRSTLKRDRRYAETAAASKVGMVAEPGRNTLGLVAGHALAAPAPRAVNDLSSPVLIAFRIRSG